MFIFKRMHRKPYWMSILIISIFAILIYNLTLFRSIPGKSRLVSELLLCLTMVVVGTIFGYCNDSDKDRRLVNVILMALFGLELFWFLSSSYLRIPSALYKSMMCIHIALFLIYGIHIFRTPIKESAIRKKVMHARRMKVLDFGLTSFTLCVSVMLVYSAIDSPVLVHKKAATSSVEDVEEAVVENIYNAMDTLVLLTDDTWPTLDESDKIRVLQTVADIETTYMGLPYRVTVVVDNEHAVPVGALACYSNESHTIYLAKSHLADSGEELCNSVCHEACHAYQYELLSAYDSLDPEYKNLLIFDSIRYYAAELSQYVGSDENDDVEEYAQQLCEVNARKWAATSTEDYFDKIEMYLETNGNLNKNEN